MEKRFNLLFNDRLLSSNNGNRDDFFRFLEELESKGFIENGQIVYDTSQEKEVQDILNRFEVKYNIKLIER